MTQDDQRVRETVQAELRRRRGALDRGEGPSSPRRSDGNGHAARPEGEDRRDPGRRQWSLPSDTTGE